jgi:ATP-binding cassette subfamily B protein
MMFHRTPRRRWLVPEVVQTSAMDCGPAVLKCLLEGFGIRVGYGRLREACQTDVDGTSIDVLQQVAGQLGLDAEQVMLPVDQLLLPEVEALPAILVVRLPNGVTHFVLVWRRHGPFVQVMDPGVGRRWMSGKRLLEEAYIHSQRLPAETWRAWAASDGLRRPLLRRLRHLGLGRAATALFDEAAADPGWRSLALLEAGARFVESVVHAGGLRRGREAAGVLRALIERDRDETPGKGHVIPAAYWSVRPAVPEADSDEQVVIRGAVLIRVRGRRDGLEDRPAAAEQLSPELAAALAEPPSRPGRMLLRLLRGTGALAILFLVIGTVLAASSTILEALLLRGALDVGRYLGVAEQRVQAVGFFLAFAGLLLLLEHRVLIGLLRLGRRLEVRLRVEFLQKVPRLNDRYFQSRPTSDMTERSQAIQQIRLVPRLAGQFVRAALTLLVTVGAIAWTDPASAIYAGVAAAAAVGLPLVFTPLLGGLDLRARTHAGALSRFYLDALLGLAAVRAHGAERAVRREHESLLVEWVRASRQLLRAVVTVEGLQALIGSSLAGWLVLQHAGRAADVAGVLLLAYWALNLPALGEQIALLVRQYPGQRNVALRLLEPLGAPEDRDLGEREAPTAGARPPVADAPGSSSARLRRGVALTLEGVTVRAAGQTILSDVDLAIAAGSQVAIVGASGAGKSSLVGLLLGWHRAAAGRVLIDGEPLDAARLDQLRGETAWVDPAVQLWNRTLVQNLLYGGRDGSPTALGEVIAEADLYDVLQRLPDGLQTALGEGGGLLSGGEGQRVRLGRGVARAGARLVILDEPFRGLDRDKRRLLLERVRQRWHEATLLCITHDVGETLPFERVLVVEGGRVVEDGAPARLVGVATSRYRALLDAETEVRTGLWSSNAWRRLRLVGGRVVGDEPGGAP